MVRRVTPAVNAIAASARVLPSGDGFATTKRLSLAFVPAWAVLSSSSYFIVSSTDAVWPLQGVVWPRTFVPHLPWAVILVQCRVQCLVEGPLMGLRLVLLETSGMAILTMGIPILGITICPRPRLDTPNDDCFFPLHTFLDRY